MFAARQHGPEGVLGNKPLVSRAAEGVISVSKEGTSRRAVDAAGHAAEVEQLDLPDGLQAAGGVDADGFVDEPGIFEIGDFAQPHVEIDEIGAVAGDGRGVGQVRLLEIIHGHVGERLDIRRAG